MKGKVSILLGLGILMLGVSPGLFAKPRTATTPKPTVTGTILGEPFGAPFARLKKMQTAEAKISGKVTDRAQSYEIAFYVENEFVPDNEISIWFNLEMNQPIEGLNLNWRATKFGTPEHSLQSFPVKKPASVGRGITTIFVRREVRGKSKMESYSDQISATIKLGNIKNGRIPGKVVLRLPGRDGAIQGSFLAQVTK